MVQPITYTGEDAEFLIDGQDQSALGLGDFSLTVDRGTVEYELAGQKGNEFKTGAQSVEGSFTAAKLENSAALGLLGALVDADKGITISGRVGDDSLHFDFQSCMITGFDLSIGDASTVTEGDIDWQVYEPWQVSLTAISGEAKISDY